MHRLLFLILLVGMGTSFTPLSHRLSSWKWSETTQLSVVTPVGPFCPFRSFAAQHLDTSMERVTKATPDFAADMQRLQLDMMTGEQPDPERVNKIADGLEEAVDDWENLIARLNFSNDFQTKEYAKLTQAHLEKHGQSVQELSGMMRWQAGCMRAMASGGRIQPPPPPPGVDLMKMMNEAQEAESNANKPSLSGMSNAFNQGFITTTPFKGTEAPFQTEMVREEYEKLCRDHNGLIEFGQTYATFDPLGKIAFLDEIEKIEERWDVFFARFSLLGAIDQQFVTECSQFLSSMNLNEENFRTLLKTAHDLMREDAEKERNSSSSSNFS